MIYLVTGNRELFENPVYEIISVEKSLELLNKINLVGLDTETRGLNPHTGQLLCVQLGNYDFQIVIDCTTVNILLYKEYLESNRLFILWNARFDLKWLFKYGIVPKQVYDGYLAEKLLWLGYPVVLTPEVWFKIQEPRYDYVPEKIEGKKKTKPYYIMYMNLKKAGEMYLGVELDKTVRGQILYRGLDAGVIEYAALDVKYLEAIMNKQIAELSKHGLIRAMQYECKFILPLAYMEYCGARIDQAKWKEKMKKDDARLQAVEKAMDDWLIENEPHSPYITRNYQGCLFDDDGNIPENPFDSAPKVSHAKRVGLNWNSAKQVIPIFKRHGVDATVEEDGDEKDSINAKVLAPQKDKCPLVGLYIEYKELKKLVSTYGQNFLDQINLETGRLYTNFNPIGTDTGRISSGGKDKANKIKYINFLNIPSDAETRACFIAEKGCRWISIDYSGQESFIMGDMANDKAILHELTYGDKDLHTLTAKIVFSYIPQDMPAKEVKQKFHKERQLSKGYEFAFNYAGNASTIKRNFGLTDEEANRIYNAYMSGFDGLKRYQDKQKKQWWKDGYIDLNPMVGYKVHIYDYSYLQQCQASFKEPGFWDYYREMKADSPTCDTVMKVKGFFKRKADSDRQAVNYPIQHTGALCYKVSMINFFEYLRANNYLFKVFIPVTPYDEINCEAPDDIAEDVAAALYDCMVKAGAYFCRRCKLDADVSRLSLCIKDFYVDGELLAKKGDAVHFGEETFYNEATDVRLFKKIKYDKECFSEDGPLPRFWVH